MDKFGTLRGSTLREWEEESSNLRGSSRLKFGLYIDTEMVVYLRWMIGGKGMLEGKKNLHPTKIKSETFQRIGEGICVGMGSRSGGKKGYKKRTGGKR